MRLAGRCRVRLRGGPVILTRARDTSDTWATMGDFIQAIGSGIAGLVIGALADDRVDAPRDRRIARRAMPGGWLAVVLFVRARHRLGPRQALIGAVALRQLGGWRMNPRTCRQASSEARRELVGLAVEEAVRRPLVGLERGARCRRSSGPRRMRRSPQAGCSRRLRRRGRGPCPACRRRRRPAAGEPPRPWPTGEP